MRTQGEDGICKPRRGLRRSHPCWHLSLELPASRLWDNKCLLSQHPVGRTLFREGGALTNEGRYPRGEARGRKAAAWQSLAGATLAPALGRQAHSESSRTSADSSAWRTRAGNMQLTLVHVKVAGLSTQNALGNWRGSWCEFKTASGLVKRAQQGRTEKWAEHRDKEDLDLLGCVGKWSKG